jgi:hypothetical protein
VSDLDILVGDGEISGTNSVLRVYGNAGSDVKMTIEGGNFDGSVKIADAYVDAKPIEITGGTYTYDVSAYGTIYICYGSYNSGFTSSFASVPNTKLSQCENCN